MIIWIVFALLTALVAFFLSLPFAQPRNAFIAQAKPDASLYAEQLAQINEEVAQGLLPPDQCEHARHEIFRRMLHNKQVDTGHVAPSLFIRRLPFLYLLFVLPLGAIGFYVAIGNPSLPSKPYAMRLLDPDFIVADEADRMEKQLAGKPEAEGYRHLASYYLGTQQYDRAIECLRQLSELPAVNANDYSRLGEALVLSLHGEINAEAHDAFLKSYATDHKLARTRFYLGLYEAQNKRYSNAIAIWKDLQRSTPPEAASQKVLEQSLAHFSKEGSVDPRVIKAAPPSLVMKDAR